MLRTDGLVAQLENQNSYFTKIDPLAAFDKPKILMYFCTGIVKNKRGLYEVFTINMKIQGTS